MKSSLKSFAPFCSNCFVSVCNPDICRVLTFFQKFFCYHIRSIIIILINAGISLQPLSQNYNGNFVFLQHLFMLSGKHGGNKNHSVHLIVPEKRQRLQFLLNIIICICKNDLIPSFCKNITDSCYLAADRV